MGNEFSFLLYQAEHEDVSVNALIKDETVWLTQKAMAELFGVDTPAISKHLSNIYADGELIQDATVSVTMIAPFSNITPSSTAAAKGSPP